MLTRSRFFVLLILLQLYLSSVCAQGLVLSGDLQLPEVFKTNKSVAIESFNDKIYLSWCSLADDRLRLGRLSLRGGLAQELAVDTLADAQSAFSPVFCRTDSSLYLFWIDNSGVLNARHLSPGNSLLSPAQPLMASDDSHLGGYLGVTCTDSGFVIGVKDRLTTRFTLMLLRPLPGGALCVTKTQRAPFHTESPVGMHLISADTLRITWTSKKERIAQTDYVLSEDAWGRTKSLKHIYSGKTLRKLVPAKDTAAFYVWHDTKNNEGWRYANVDHKGHLDDSYPLRASSASTIAPGFCSLRRDSGMFVFTGTDNLIRLQIAHHYSPSRWMEKFLFPGKENYTLKDIVIPGSHDAGMSVLTAAGGHQAYTINECNTLTQQLSVAGQLAAGYRMFDLRIGRFNNDLYTKHASSDCMEDAIGGAYGEGLGPILSSLRHFLSENKKEFVILSFSHFCEREAPAAEVAKYIVDSLGSPLIFQASGHRLTGIPLKEFAGKVIICFEGFGNEYVSTNTMEPSSEASLNFRRAYAATNILSRLVSRQTAFFEDKSLSSPATNDLVRLDWQLTQSSQEAAMACNDFQSEEINPFFNAVLLLTNIIRKHQSIRKLGVMANKQLIPAVDSWIKSKVITKKNRPNIIYTDMSDLWVTNYCIKLNNTFPYVND